MTQKSQKSTSKIILFFFHRPDLPHLKICGGANPDGEKKLSYFQKM